MAAIEIEKLWQAVTEQFQKSPISAIAIIVGLGLLVYLFTRKDKPHLEVSLEKLNVRIGVEKKKRR